MRHLKIAVVCSTAVLFCVCATWAAEKPDAIATADQHDVLCVSDKGEKSILNTRPIGKWTPGQRIENGAAYALQVTSQPDVRSGKAGPGDVKPVTHDGVRYEALHWGKSRNLGQNGGLIAAYDSASGDELWVERIYEIVYGDKSPHKYDIFIRSMVVIDDGTALQIIDEIGRVFRVRLADRDVLLVTQPANVPHKPNSEKPPPASD